MTSKAVHSKDRKDPVELNKNFDSSKENTPVGDVERKIESRGKHNPDEGKEKQDNVRGFASTSSGGVSQINVTGASRSNVHGFGGHSPARKKPCGGNGVVAGKLSGNKNIVRNPGGSGTTGLAVRGNGSRTVTVKGKTGTQTETKVKECSNEASHIAFQGHGHTLGGSVGKVSRLLSLSTSQFHSNSPPPSTALQTQTNSESNIHSGAKINRRDGTSCSPVSSAEGNATPKLQKSLDCFVVTPTSEPIRKTVRCPVCDASVPERDINEHLDECVGNLSDDDVMKDKTSCEEVPSFAGEEVMSLGDSSINDSGELSQAEGEEGEQYPCPVCGECCTPATVNQHLDSHF